jgi:hypothetical protein
MQQKKFLNIKVRLLLHRYNQDLLHLRQQQQDKPKMLLDFLVDCQQVRFCF